MTTANPDDDSRPLFDALYVTKTLNKQRLSGKTPREAAAELHIDLVGTFFLFRGVQKKSRTRIF